MGEQEEAPPPLEWETVPASKKEIRDKIWGYIDKHELVEFPKPVTDRIPNVKGTDKAADKLLEMKEFQNAKVVVVNPDKPQENVRYHSLEKGKQLLVPTPRLRSGLFNQIVPPTTNEEDLRKCATQQGVIFHRQPITLESETKIDVIFTGCVAVSKKGTKFVFPWSTEVRIKHGNPQKC